MGLVDAGQSLDTATRSQVTEQLSKRVGQHEIVQRGDAAGVAVFQRINQDLEPVAEQLAETFEDAAVERLVITLIEQRFERTEPHDQRNPAVRITEQVSGQPVKLRIVADHHRVPGRFEHFGPADEVLETHLAFRAQVVHRDFHDRQRFARRGCDRRIELSPRCFDHVHVDVRDRAEPAPLDDEWSFSQDVGWLQHRPVGGEQRRAGQPELDQPERHHPVVHVCERRPGELDQIDLETADAETVEQALDQRDRVIVVKKRPVDEVDADDAECLLL